MLREKWHAVSGFTRAFPGADTPAVATRRMEVCDVQATSNRDYLVNSNILRLKHRDTV